MSSMYIEEYESLAQINNGGLIQAGRQLPLAVQKITFTGTAGSSAAFNAKTKYVRIHPDAICSYRFGTAGTGQDATVGYPRMIAGQTEYFATAPGQFLSTIANT